MKDLDVVRIKRSVVALRFGSLDNERRLERHSVGTIIDAPSAGYALVEFDPDKTGGGWFCDVPTKYLEVV